MAIPMFLLICIISFYIFQYSPKSLNDLLGTNKVNITKVFMKNGNNGSYVETTDKEKIKELTNLLNDRYYKKALNQESRVGYSYFYDFYKADKWIIRITGSGNNVEVNNVYYNVSKSIPTTSLANWFNSLPINDYK
jgi:hypothetical protein